MTVIPPPSNPCPLLRLERKNVAYDWNLGASGNYWVKLYINNPNHQYFTPVNITLTCT